LKETTGKTKMETETRMRKAVTTITTTKKATTKGMKMRVRVERLPHKYDPDFCQVIVQPGRRILVLPGQRPTNLIPQRQNWTGVLKF
jgi:hypothetical protein